MTLTATPRLHAQLDGPTALGEAGVTELTLTNDGRTRDVYRLTVETEFHQQASAHPSVIRLEPGSSQQVTVSSQAPVALRVYSQVSGQRISEVFLSR